jgi:hypothetical protein
MFFRHHADGTTLVDVGKAEKKNPFVNRLATWYGEFIGGKVGELFREDGTVFRSGGLAHFSSMAVLNLTSCRFDRPRP